MKTSVLGLVSFLLQNFLPPACRLSSLPQKFKNDEYLSALGLGALAIINLAEDWRDIKKATQQVNDKLLSKNIKDYFKKNHNNFFKNFVEYDELYSRKEYQHSFSFFRGTLLDKYISKGIEENKNWAKVLDKLDSSIYKTASLISGMSHLASLRFLSLEITFLATLYFLLSLHKLIFP